MSNTNLTVLVLGGGPDRERQISLQSASNVALALREAGHDVIEADVNPHDLSGLKTRCDIVFPVFHGLWGEGGGIHVARFGETPRFIPSGQIDVENPVQHEVRAFVESVRNDTPAEIPGEVGRAAVEIAEAGYRSIETGKPVQLPL